MKLVVIALGGNALLRRGELPEAAVQKHNVSEAADAIARIAQNYRVVVTHGNGPQVGLLALQAEAYKPVAPYPLDVLGAESEGMIGYMLEQELVSRISNRQVATLLTQVVVDPFDPAFMKPTKPIGPFYNLDAGTRLKDELGWSITEVQGALRRVVASPSPQRILELKTIRLLVDANVVTICGGGGGIPVTISKTGGIKGVEAVVDKDRTACLLASELSASHLVILTDVPAVYTAWGNPDARAIRRATPDRLNSYGFAEGSMAPKVEAACAFVTNTGGTASIGTLADGLAMVHGEAGTQIVPGSEMIEWYD